MLAGPKIKTEQILPVFLYLARYINPLRREDQMVQISQCHHMVHGWQWFKLVFRYRHSGPLRGLLGPGEVILFEDMYHNRVPSSSKIN